MKIAGPNRNWPIQTADRDTPSFLHPRPATPPLLFVCSHRLLGSSHDDSPDEHPQALPRCPRRHDLGIFGRLRLPFSGPPVLVPSGEHVLLPHPLRVIRCNCLNTSSYCRTTDSVAVGHRPVFLSPHRPVGRLGMGRSGRRDLGCAQTRGVYQQPSKAFPS